MKNEKGQNVKSQKSKVKYIFYLFANTKIPVGENDGKDH